MKKILFLIPFIALSACKDEETKTVDYYRANKAERSVKLEECRNNPGEKAKTPNCINAKKAEVQSTLDPANTGMPQIR